MKARRAVSAGRFRRRLTLAFLLVAALAAGVIGVGGYLLVREFRTSDFLERSLHDAEANYLSIVDRGEPEDEAAFDLLAARVQRRGADGIVLLTPDAVYVSRETLGLDAVPKSLEAPTPYTANADLPHREVVESGQRYLVVVTPSTPSGSTLYVFYSRHQLEAGLDELAGVLLRLWLLVVVAAGVFGHLLARRTLRPVSIASDAARALAEGLLDTRVPVEREDEFGAWAVSFNEMADALQENIDALTEARDRERQFTADVSHELKTPLTALLTSASMLEGHLDKLDADARWSAERVILETRRLRVLVDDLLEISRLHSGRETVRDDPVEVKTLLEETLRVHGWTDAVALEGPPIHTITDKARAVRIFANVIGNAVEHGRRRPRVRLRQDGSDPVVAVSDDGPGITKDHLGHIFERFYKADPARGGGSGLGLAIAAENARLLGWNIAVESERGSGTTFTIALRHGSGG